MVLTPEGLTDNSPISPNQYEPNKNPSAVKPLCQISESLDVKHKLFCGLGDVKAKRKAIRTRNM